MNPRQEIKIALKALGHSDDTFTVAGREALEHLSRTLSKILAKPAFKSEAVQQIGDYHSI